MAERQTQGEGWRGWRAFGGDDWDWNRIGVGAGAAAAMAGAAYAASRLIGRRGDEDEEQFRLLLETDENLRLISSRKVEGTPVYGRGGERLGKVDSFMVDKYTGRVAYAVMTFGGHFGFGASLFPLPWAALDYDEELDGYMLDIGKEELKDAPRFEANDEPEFDREYRRTLLIFYRRGGGGSESAGETARTPETAGAL